MLTVVNTKNKKYYLLTTNNRYDILIAAGGHGLRDFRVGIPIRPNTI